MTHLSPRDPVGNLALEVRDLADRLAQLDLRCALRRDGLERTLYSALQLADHASRLTRASDELRSALSPGCSSVEP